MTASISETKIYPRQAYAVITGKAVKHTLALGLLLCSKFELLSTHAVYTTVLARSNLASVPLNAPGDS